MPQDKPPELPADFFSQKPPELPSDFFKPKKPRTPQETESILKSRYPQAYQDQPGVATQVLKGAAKTVASDFLDPFGAMSTLRKTAGAPGAPGVPSALEVQGPGEEAGQIITRGAEAIPAAIGGYRLLKAGAGALGEMKEARDLAKAVKAEKLKRAAKEALGGPKLAKEAPKAKSYPAPKSDGITSEELRQTRHPTSPPEAPKPKVPPPRLQGSSLARQTAEEVLPAPEATKPKATKADVEEISKKINETLPPPKTQAKNPKGAELHARNKTTAAVNIAKALKTHADSAGMDLTVKGFDKLLAESPETLKALAKSLGHEVSDWSAVREQIELGNIQ